MLVVQWELWKPSKSAPKFEFCWSLIFREEVHCALQSLTASNAPAHVSQHHPAGLQKSLPKLKMLFFRFARPYYELLHVRINTNIACPTNSFFKTLVDHEVTVELKNDIQIRGTLKSVDQYLNIKLDDIQVVEELKYPHLVSPALCTKYGSPRARGTRGERSLICIISRLSRTSLSEAAWFDMCIYLVAQ